MARMTRHARSRQRCRDPSRATTGTEAPAPVEEAPIDEAPVDEAVVETDTVEETELTPPTPSDEVVADAEADSVDDSTPTDETASESDDAEETN